MKKNVHVATIELSILFGSTGDTGPTGPTGAQGDPGISDITGPQGPPGLDNASGQYIEDFQVDGGGAGTYDTPENAGYLHVQLWGAGGGGGGALTDNGLNNSAVVVEEEEGLPKLGYFHL